MSSSVFLQLYSEYVALRYRAYWLTVADGRSSRLRCLFLIYRYLISFLISETVVLLRKYGDWGSVLYIDFCKFWVYVVWKEFFIEMYIGFAIIWFPFLVLISVDVCWTGVCNV